MDNDRNYLDNFEGHKDPFFCKVPKFIKNELDNLDYENENVIFKIQMYYMLLWSAIERYCKLKYDVSDREGDYLKALGNDEIYQEAFVLVNPEDRDPIHSAKNASTFNFDKTKQNFIINYYYTIRCNVAHRGKEPENNLHALETSLRDMLKIFCRMIKLTFGSDEEC